MGAGGVADGSDEALEHLAKACRERPAESLLHNSRGVVLMSLARYNEAEEAFRRALGLDADSIEALVNLGQCLSESGRAGAAVEVLRRAVQLAPDWERPGRLLGMALLKHGESVSGLEQLRSAARADKRARTDESHLGKERLAAGDVEGAEECFQRVLEREPGDIGALFGLARIAERRGQLDRVVECCVAVLKQDSGFAPAHVMLGLALSSRLRSEFRARMEIHERYGLIERALEHLEKATRLQPMAETFDAYGVGLTRAARQMEAIACFHRARDLDGRFAPTFEHLGQALLELGRIDEAAVEFRRAIELSPTLAVAHYELSQIAPAEPSEAEHSRALLETVLAEEPLDDISRGLLHFALARRFDQLGRFDDAFTQYRNANQSKIDPRTRGRLDAGDSLIPRSIEVFVRGFFQARRSWGSTSDRPVFVVGMPRSGTTLLEQILARHPEVHGAGELIDICDLCLILPRRLGVSTRYPEAAQEATPEVVGQMAEEYLDVLRSRDGHARHVVDKMPTNFRYVGLIAMLFPRARLIHMRRDPLDVCVSCFRQNLEWPFCDLEAAAEYCLRYRRLMDHWHEVVPMKILDVDYEALVQDQEGQARRVLEYLGLDWDRRCLEFHSPGSSVQTASKWQVRQPIYKSSVGAWRRYERHLTPVKRILERGD